jgi:hypothetical protein
MSEMNEGIRILINRMKTNPEDFAPPGFNVRDAYVKDSAPWRSLAEYAGNASVFTEEERATVSAALDEVTRKNFTARVLEVLAALPMEEKKYSPWSGPTASREGYGQTLSNNPRYNSYEAAQQQAKFK